MNNDTPAPVPADQDLYQATDALAELPDSLRRSFAALGPEKGQAVDALLAEGGM